MLKKLCGYGIFSGTNQANDCSIIFFFSPGKIFYKRGRSLKMSCISFLSFSIFLNIFRKSFKVGLCSASLYFHLNFSAQCQ